MGALGVSLPAVQNNEDYFLFVIQYNAHRCSSVSTGHKHFLEGGINIVSISTYVLLDRQLITHKKMWRLSDYLVCHNWFHTLKLVQKLQRSSFPECICFLELLALESSFYFINVGYAEWRGQNRFYTFLQMLVSITYDLQNIACTRLYIQGLCTSSTSFASSWRHVRFHTRGFIWLWLFFFFGVACTCAFLPNIFSWRFSNASDTTATCTIFSH